MFISQNIMTMRVRFHLSDQRRYYYKPK